VGANNVANVEGEQVQKIDVGRVFDEVNAAGVKAGVNFAQQVVNAR
jgi:hypothetical protein